MTITRRAMGAGIGLLAAAALRGATAQEAYPGSRPVTVVAPFAAGGSTDFVARLISNTFFFFFSSAFRSVTYCSPINLPSFPGGSRRCGYGEVWIVLHGSYFHLLTRGACGL